MKRHVHWSSFYDLSRDCRAHRGFGGSHLRDARGELPSPRCESRHFVGWRMSRFSDTLMDHFAYPRNTGTIEAPDRVGTAGQPGQGPYIALYLKLEGETVVAGAVPDPRLRERASLPDRCSPN